MDSSAGDDQLSTWQLFLRSVEGISLINVWWLLGAVLVTVILIGVCVAVIRRHHRWWLVLLLPATLAATVASAAFAVNYELGWVSTVGKLFGVPPFDVGTPAQLANPTGKWPRGQVIETTIPGTTSGVGDHFAMVYLPPQYFDDPTATFPVVYALHGTPGVEDPRGEDAGPYDIFVNAEADNPAQAAAAAGQPVVVIAPVVSPMSKDTECVDGPMGNWQTYLSVDVPAWAGQYPRLRTGSQDTAIGGFSMGGTCAQVTALRLPDQFSSAGNLSGFTKASNEAGDAALFGSGSPAAYDSSAIIANDPAAKSVALWLGVGADDDPELVADMSSFAKAAQADGMTVEYTTYAGGHTFDVWRLAIADWIKWTAQRFYSAGN